MKGEHNMDSRRILITLYRDNNIEEVLKTLIVSGDFTSEVDAEDRKTLIFKKNSTVELIKFTFESENACLDAISYMTECLGGDQTYSDKNEVLFMPLRWDDEEMKNKRLQLIHESRVAWEECDCSPSEDGCDKCLKNEKFKLIYLSEKY